MKQDKLIMLVDDDEIYQFIFSQMVDDAGINAKVVTCKDATECLNRIRDAQHDHKLDEIPDLVFLDINMPVMNGWDFLEEYRKVREGDKDPSFAMLSSSVFDSDKKKAENYPEVIDFIVKPISEDSLKNLTRKFLGR
jgi:CheY-like chemotaxis protein